MYIGTEVAMYIGPDPLWPWYVQGAAYALGVFLICWGSGAWWHHWTQTPSEEETHAARYRASHGRQ